MTGSLGQSSLLHVGSSRIDRGRLESALHLVQSTSPSYLLMTSLDAARYELALHGEEMLEKTCQMAEDARERIRQIPGMECYGKELLGEKIYDLDTTRLVISASALGLTGFELADILYEEYGVGLELSDEKNAVAIVTYANEPEDMERLIKALESISRKERKNFENPGQTKLPGFASICHEPKTGIFFRKKSDFVERCSGRNRRGGADSLSTGHSHPESRRAGDRRNLELYGRIQKKGTAFSWSCG